MIAGQIKAIYKHNPNVDFLVYRPLAEECSDEKDFLYFLEPVLRSKVKELRCHYTLNAATNRFHFNIEELLSQKDLLETVDIIFNSNIELTLNLIAFFKFYLNKKPKFISGIHYLDIKNDESAYFFRQVDGIMTSNLTIFYSYNLYDTFFNFASTLLTQKFIELMKKRCKVIDYMVFNEVELFRCITPKLTDKKTILFISRCTDDERTRWKFFIKSIKELNKRRNDFEAILMNPTEVSTNELIAECGDTIKNLYWYSALFSASRDTYILNLWNADIVPFMYNNSKYPSIGLFEAAYCDNHIVEYGYEFRNDSNFVDALDIALNNVDANLPFARKKWFIDNGSCEKNADRFFKEVCYDI
jgi:hypothetical protein